ncbi:MAG TPA: cyanophycin synthetase, partial [Rubricoccaceae bacterium]
ALNLAAAYASGVALGFDEHDVFDALASAPGVPGRFETVRAENGVLGVVDYAHSPDALDNVLATAREIVPPGGRLTVVFGCGGDRDRTKRPEMARVAEARADRVVLTSDNPRTEAPAAILDEVRAGLSRPDAAAVVVDRAEAIALAVAEASPGDVVVVAGKGHETYQVVGTERRHFDDREALRDAFAAVPVTDASSERETA